MFVLSLRIVSTWYLYYFNLKWNHYFLCIPFYLTNLACQIITISIVLFMIFLLYTWDVIDINKFTTLDIMSMKWNENPSKSRCMIYNFSSIKLPGTMFLFLWHVYYISFHSIGIRITLILHFLTWSQIGTPNRIYSR